jgi:hypothetical protein
MIDIRDFILFMKKPSLGTPIDIISFSLVLKVIWKSFLILFLIDIIIGILISTPLRYFDLFPSQKAFNLSLYNILKVALLLPVVEELIFRLPLKINKVNLSTSFSIVLFLSIYKLNIYLGISLSIILFGILFLLFQERSKILIKVDNFFSKYLNLFFYLQALIFGLLHLMNYDLDLKIFYLFPFYILSQILTGCFLGYLRLKYTYGIYLCIATHIVVNSIYCLLLYHWN